MNNGVSKGITKENIINVTLKLIKDKENIRSVNLREIARTIGCAHTNLYNHFEDLDGIFCESLDEILKRSSEFILSGMNQVKDPEIKMKYFYKRIVEFYLVNTGWFRLFWMEKLKGEIPAEKMKMISETVDKYVAEIIKSVNEIFKIEMNQLKAKDLFHIVHCYLYGEISIFISGKSLIKEEEAFMDYVVKQSVQLTRLLVNSEEAIL